MHPHRRQCQLGRFVLTALPMRTLETRKIPLSGVGVGAVEEDAEAEGDEEALQPLGEVALTLKGPERVTIRGLGDLSLELSPATLWQTITRRETAR